MSANTVNYNELIDRFVALWNEPDPQARRKLVDELWAEDGTYVNRLFTAQGRDLIDNVIATAHKDYVAKGFSFKSSSNANAHHNGITFTWVLVCSATGEVDTFCEDFIILDDRGQIALDYQFGLRTPPI